MLTAAAEGDRAQSSRLSKTLYGELRSVAQGYMRSEGEHTLQPTALVHEAWMKIFGAEELSFRDRHHLLATAARAMRQVLVDHARGRKRAKRGAGWNRVTLSVEPAADLSSGRGRLTSVCQASGPSARRYNGVARTTSWQTSMCQSA